MLAYEDQDIQPWKHRRRARIRGTSPQTRPSACAATGRPGNTSPRGCSKPGSMSPMPTSPCTTRWATPSRTRILLLDDDRRGFDYPLVPFSVNCYGRRVNAARGLRLPLAMRDNIRDLDPPSPNPHRCMAVGAATARVMAKPVADRDRRLVELVALVPDREELPALARCRRRPRGSMTRSKRAITRLAPLYDRPDRGQRPARGAELVLPAGRDGGARPQARQVHLYRDLGLRLAGRVCLLSGLKRSQPKSRSRRKPGPILRQRVRGEVGPGFCRDCGS